MSNQLKYLIIHCTATPEGREVYPADIIKWHTSPVEKGGRGWKKVGYSDMIMINQGLLMNLVKYNDDDVVDSWEITNGATGINSNARHIVYAGGTDAKGNPKDTRNPAQLDTMIRYVREFIKKHPTILIAGHNQFANKACPSFDVPKWLRSIGVSESNIHKP